MESIVLLSAWVLGALLSARVLERRNASIAVCVFAFVVIHPLLGLTLGFLFGLFVEVSG